MLTKERLIYGCPNHFLNDLEVFERRVQKAASCGFTHFDIGQLHDRGRWAIDDPSDPWLQWNLANPSLFKILPPDELKDFVPVDEAAINLNLVINKGKILEKYGLKGMFTTWDPTWMPESFFHKHPEWRGPRIDHPRRSMHKRFAPCMDHPGVLALYREAVRKLLALVPCIDMLHIYTNDSGAGMCWSSHLYNSPNGPEACAHIPMGKRVATYLDNFRQGGLEAGIDLQVTLMSQLNQVETEAILQSLKPGTGLVDWNGTVEPGREHYKRVAAHFMYPIYFIVCGLPTHAILADGLRDAYDAPTVLAHLQAFSEDYFDDFMDMTAAAFASETNTITDRHNILLSIASKKVGTKNAPALVEVWELVREGLNLICHPFGGSYIIEAASLMQRWLTRPFVPFPLELTEEERSYFWPHLFQLEDDELKADMMNIQGSRLIDSRGAANFMSRLWGQAIGLFMKAEHIAAQQPGCKNIVHALRVMQCLCKNAINCASFQSIMDEYAGHDGIKEAVSYDAGNIDRAVVYKIYRAEIDNTYTLLNILAECPDIIETGERPEQEDQFTFSPDLAGQLRKKIEIMMNHWQDFDRVFPRPNR